MTEENKPAFAKGYGVAKEEPTFAERLKIEPIRKKCVCGKSKKYPLCDGSHNVS
jgi:CDGSH-type Zn-finger protein